MLSGSGPTMSTTGKLKTKTQKEFGSANERAVMHVALLGDFSGKQHLLADHASSLNTRRSIEIDRDNFEDIFTQLKVSLYFPNLEQEVGFNEFDELHPDHLYQNLEIFERFRTLKRRLKNPKLFESAANEIRAWDYRKDDQDIETENKEEKQKNEAETKSASNVVVLDDDTLEHLFSNAPDANTSNQSLDSAKVADQLIKEIVAPFVQKKPDPQLTELLTIVDDACSETMRKLLHTSSFKNIESTWRSVYHLIRRINAGSRLKFFLFDISKEEIINDFWQSSRDVESSALYKLLVESRTSVGDIPYSLINADYFIHDELADLDVVQVLSYIAWVNNGAALLGGSPLLANCTSIEKSSDPDDWSYVLNDEFQNIWRELRKKPEAKHMALVAPRTLLRLPYGKKTSPIDSFEFQELYNGCDHNNYCWGNSVYSVTYLLAESFTRFQWKFKPGQVQELSGLPVHVYRDEYGEEKMMNCGEVLLTDTGAHHLNASGLIAIRSVRNKDSIVVWNFCSIAPDTPLRGPWRSL